MVKIHSISEKLEKKKKEVEKKICITIGADIEESLPE